MYIIGGLRVIIGDTDIRLKLVFFQNNFRHIRKLDLEEDSEG